MQLIPSINLNPKTMISESKRKNLLKQISVLQEELQQLQAKAVNEEQPPTVEELQEIRVHLLLKSDAVLLALFSCLI